MKNIIISIIFVGIIFFALLVFKQTKPSPSESKTGPTPTIQYALVSVEESKNKTNEDWKKILTSDQYKILRTAGTETPYTGALLHEKRAGTYYSAGCDTPLFRSETKFESGTGWPSFYEAIKDSVILKEDTSFGATRVEVLDKCGNHLGHVFDDGPEPTGKRFCMNSIALRFVPDEK